MNIVTKENYNLRYSFGSLITLSAQFYNNGALFDPITTKIVIKNIINNVVVVQSRMQRVAKGYYYYNVSTRVPIGQYEAIYSGIENINGEAFETTKSERIEVIQIIGKDILPVDPISKLRIDLRDNNTDPDYWVWTDIELEEYLCQALSDINITPPKTTYNWINVPDDWIQCIKRGAQNRALYAKATEVAHQPISYSDKGVSVDKRAQAAFYKTLADQFHTIFSEEKKIIKRNHYPSMGWLTVSEVPYVTIPPLRSINRVFC